MWLTTSSNKVFLPYNHRAKDSRNRRGSGGTRKMKASCPILLLNTAGRFMSLKLKHALQSKDVQSKTDGDFCLCMQHATTASSTSLRLRPQPCISTAWSKHWVFGLNF